MTLSDMAMCKRSRGNVSLSSDFISLTLYKTITIA